MRPILSIGKLFFKSENIFHIVAISVVCQCYDNCATVAMIQWSILVSLNFVGFTIRYLTTLDGFCHSVSHFSHSNSYASLLWVITNLLLWWCKSLGCNCLMLLHFFVTDKLFADYRPELRQTHFCAVRKLSNTFSLSIHVLLIGAVRLHQQHRISYWNHQQRIF